MGWWKGAKGLHSNDFDIFIEGMSTKMEHKFEFVNIAGGVYHDITKNIIATKYNTSTEAA